MSSTTTSFSGNFPVYSGAQVNSLADTDVASPTDLDALAWNSTTAKWENRFDGSTNTVVTTDATAAAATYNAAELIGGLILRDPAGADRTDTISTAALLVAAMPGAIVGSSFRVTVRNTADAAETITVAAGTGITLSGTATIAQNNTKEFLIVLTNVTSGSEAATMYSIGSYVH